MSDAAPIAVRLATPDDAATLTRLAARLFEDAFGADNTPQDMAAYVAATFTEARQRSELADPDSRVWFATMAGESEPLGYAHVRISAPPEGVRARHPAELARLYVDRAWHGRGVAVALMDACLAQSRDWGCDGTWLGVWHRNPRAIAFYERHGFVQVGTYVFWIGDDAQTDWVMERAP